MRVLQRETILKTAFYFRTRTEFWTVAEYVQKLNSEANEGNKWRSKEVVKVYTRYKNEESRSTWTKSIPLEVSGDKKYIGVVQGNKYKLRKLGIYPDRFLTHLGLELVHNAPNKAKYTGEKTLYATTLRSHNEFKTVTSVFDKRFGQGNWRIQGPKRLQDILRKIEPRPEQVSSPFIILFDQDDRNGMLAKYPGGVPVTFIANEANADIAKLLFKVILKG